MRTKSSRIIVCEKCGRSREYFAKNMCHVCYNYVRAMNTMIHCNVCGRDNVPYGGKGVCKNCAGKKYKQKNDTPERRKNRAIKERERRRILGDKLLEKERQRGIRRRAEKKYKEDRLQWQREHKDYLREYRKYYRQIRNEKVKTWDQNKRVRKQNAGKISPEEWKAILEKYNHSCYYCGASDVHLEQEHKTPLIRGGKHCVENVVPACRECNAKKYTKTEEEFMASLA